MVHPSPRRTVPRVALRIGIAGVFAMIASATSAAENRSMNADARSTRVVAPSATLEARFEGARQGTLRVSYSVRNTGTGALMIPDRGFAVAGKLPALADGESAVPLVKDDDGSVTLTHAVVALPKPTPTVPRVALAARVEAGASHDGAFSVEMPRGTKRVRYCAAVVPFSKEAFTAVDDAKNVWRASYEIVEAQELVCTTWFEIAEAEFIRG